MYILRPLMIVGREWLGNNKFGAVHSSGLDGGDMFQIIRFT